MSSNTIAVVFTLDGRRHEGVAEPGEIIHEVFPRVLPAAAVSGRRVTFRSGTGAELFADNFIRDVLARDGRVEIMVTSEPIPESDGEWRNLGIDHLAITVADRAGARDFLRDVLRLRVMRDDAHLTVMATGLSAVFLFDAGVDAPMSDPEPSQVHHLGFVVDDLAAAVRHIRRTGDRFASEFAMLERDERWSLYGHYRNGDVTFMIQLSEIKAAERGLTDGAVVSDTFYDYARRPYGLVFGEPE